MQGRTMKTSLTVVCLFWGLGFLGCGSNTTSSTLDPTAFGEEFKLSSSDIQGWSQSTAVMSFWTGKGTELEIRIDGGNEPYVTRGCLVAMYQDLVGPDPQACEVVVMDFGTEAHANSMFTYEKQLRSASVPIAQYDTSAAIGSATLGGVSVYAYSKALYFEVQLTGYADQNAAVSVAAQFLRILESKAK